MYTLVRSLDYYTFAQNAHEYCNVIYLNKQIFVCEITLTPMCSQLYAHLDAPLISVEMGACVYSLYQRRQYSSKKDFTSSMRCFYQV